MSSNSKGGGSTGSKSYNYYGTIAAGYSAGPLERLDGIDIDNVRVWNGPLLRSESTNPVTISIPGRGNLRFYWGTEDQLTTDSALTSTGNGLFHDHPAYTGDAYCVLIDFLFGLERTSAPDVRFVGVRKPVQSLITGAATDLVDDQCNPFVYMAELLTSERYGLGHPLSMFAASAWQAAADAVISRAAQCYVSPWLDRQQNARTVGLDLLSLCDGWIRAERGTGRAEAGIYPPPQSLVLASLPMINSAALAGPGRPQFEPQTLDDVVTRTVVNFTDRAQNFKTRSVKYDDPLQREGIKAQSVSAEHFIARTSQADDWVVRKGRRDSMPKILSSGLNVRAARAANLRAGTHARTDIDPEPGGAQLEQVIRIDAITRSPTGPARIEFESEPTLAPILYTPIDDPTPPALVEIPEILTSMIFEVPPVLAGGREFCVGVLADRPGQLVTELNVLYDPAIDSTATFPLLGSSRNYAVRGAVDAAYAEDASGALRVAIVSQLGREIIAENPGPTAARNDDLLMLIFGAPVGSIEGSPPYSIPLEIFSVSDFVSVATNTVNVLALRARQGTPAMAHAVGAAVWFIRREALPIFYHADFGDQFSLDSVLYFKLQPGTFQASRPLEDVTATMFRFNTTREYAPVITLTSPVNDSGKDYVSCGLDATLAFTGHIDDVDSNLSGFTITKRTTAGEEQVVNHTVVNLKLFNFSESITFDAAGIYSITLTARDSSGRSVVKTVEVRCATSITGACEAVVRTVSYDDRRRFEPDPAEGYRGFIMPQNNFFSPSMALFGGPSTTVRIRAIAVGVGEPAPALPYPPGSANTVLTVDQLDEYYDSSGIVYRWWAYAEDTTGALSPSPVRCFDQLG